MTLRSTPTSCRHGPIQADRHNVLYTFEDGDRGFEKPRHYRHSCGVVVWRITNNLFGVHLAGTHGVDGSGWNFFTAPEWQSRWLTPPPTHLALGGMAMLGHLIKRSKDMPFHWDSISAPTLVHILRDSLRAAEVFQKNRAAHKLQFAAA